MNLANSSPSGLEQNSDCRDPLWNGEFRYGFTRRDLEFVLKRHLQALRRSTRVIFVTLATVGYGDISPSIARTGKY